MKVLQAMAGAEYGGAEAFFTRLVLALDRAGLDQRVVIRKSPRRAAALRAGGIEPVELPFGGAFDFATRAGFRHVIKAYRPDIVLTWMNRATRFCPGRGDFVHAARLGGYYNLKYYRGCDHLIANTEDIAAYLKAEGRSEERVHHLPNFVSEERRPALRRASLYTPERVPLIVALGRLHENKAFDVLLQAISRVPDAYLWLAGEGPERAALEALALKLGIMPRVRFLGWREDTAALLAAADMFVCPSRHEPLGNVVVEAWAQEKPVIATDSIGPGNLIDHMETGILVSVDDDRGMAEAIKMLRRDTDLAERLARAGRAAYEAGYTQAAVVKRYLDFFQGLLS